MTFRLLTALFVLFAGILANSEPQQILAAEEAAPQLRVLSYNIRHSRGSDDVRDLNRIAEVIKRLNPDLVALQEVDQGVSRSDGVDQPAELGRLTDMNVCFGANLKHGGGLYGNAILSRFPIEKFQNHPLPNEGKAEPRGVLEAQINWPVAEQKVYFYSTHRDVSKSDNNRVGSAKLIANLAESRNTGIHIVAGDFNATPDSAPLAVLKDWGGDRGDRFLTYPVDPPERQIDFILTSPQHRLRILKTEVIDEKVASDHLPILTVFEWITEENSTN